MDDLTYPSDLSYAEWAVLEPLVSPAFTGHLERFGLDAAAAARVAASLESYPFAARRYPDTAETVRHLAALGAPVIVSDGDQAVQPFKVAHSGLAADRAQAERAFAVTTEAEYLHGTERYDLLDEAAPAAHPAEPTDRDLSPGRLRNLQQSRSHPDIVTGL